MQCLIDFLDDTYQNRLRLLAQLKSERYEDTLDCYKNIFLANFNNIEYECTANCACKKYCNDIRNTINKIDEEEIIIFFDTLKQIYLNWIDANSIQALNAFLDLLDKYDILNFVYNISKSDIYFKGRLTNQVLTSWDMFHIPFNKRYLINNQRYSLTGQPLVYIGSSVLDIASELDVTDIENFKVSSIKIPCDMKIYDLRNNIYDLLSDMTFNTMLDKQETAFTKANFFKIILSSVCSFQKKQELKGYSFCEEYVLPQILAQILKTKNYDGILYYSTKKYDNIEFKAIPDNDQEYVKNNTKLKNCILGYKENIAIFTNLNTEHVYDRELFQKLDISVPIDINKIEKLTISNLEEIQNKILNSKEQDKISQSDKMVSSFKRIYSNMTLNNKSYTETDLGLLHIYQLFSALNQIFIKKEDCTSGKPKNKN